MLQYNPSISGSLSVTGSLIVTNGVIGTVSGVDVQIFSSSINQVITGIQSTTSSQDGRLTSIESFTSSTSARLGSIETISASNLSRLNSIENITSSNIARIGSLEIASESANSRLVNLENKTGSLATTGSNTFYGQQVFSGSLYVQNDLIVQGSSSLQNITASAVSIGTNIVNLNTANPAVRYGGISVQDSGSASGVTGSLLWDSTCNRWVYANPSGVGYSGGIIMSGPRAATLGSEVTLTCNYIAKSGGGDHLYDSCIWEMSGSVGINTNSPEATLHIAANSPYIYFDDLSSTGTKKRTRFVNGDVGTCQSLTIGFGCLNGLSNIDVLTLNELGNAGFGTNTPNSGKVEIQTNSTSPALWVQTGGTTAGYCIVSIRTGTNAPAFEVYGNATSYFGGIASTNGLTVLNGNQLRIYNTGNGDYGNVTFVTTTGFTFDKALQSAEKVGTCDNKGFYLRGTADSTHRLYYNSSDGSNVWEYNTPIKFNYYNLASPTTRMLFDTSGNMCVTGVISAGGCIGVGTTTPGDLLEVYGGTNKGINICSSTQPRLGFFVGGASTNNKIWDFIPQDNNTFIARIVNDAKDSAGIWLSATRSGTTMTSICFPQATPIYIAGCLGIGVVPNAPGLRIAVDTTLRVEGASTSTDNYGISLGGHGAFSIDCPGVGGGRFIIKDNGSVGVGTTSICGKFHINAGGVTAGAPQYGWPYYNAELDSQAKQIVFDAGGNGGVATAGTGPTMALILGTYFDSRAVITPFGAGSSSPGDQGTGRGKDLLIKGGTSDNTNTYKGGRLFLNGGVGFNGGSYGSCVGDIIMQCMGSDGKVGIGASPGSSGKLLVFDTGCTITSGNVTFGSQAKGIEVYNACSGVTDNVIGYWISTGPHKAGIASGRTNAASSWEVDLRFYVHPTDISGLDNAYERMRLYGGGNLTINGSLTQNGSLSDITLKENLVKISNPLEKISCISGYTFEWKEGSPARRDFSNIINDAGLIAQEVESVMPDIVRSNECIKALNYNGVIGLLVEGMKTQQCTIDTLKSCLGIS